VELPDETCSWLSGDVDLPDVDLSNSDDEDEDKEEVEVSGKSKRKRRSAARPKDISIAAGYFHDPTFELNNTEGASSIDETAAKSVWDEQRWTFSTLDAVTLLDLGGEFVKKWSQIKNKFYFVFADVPWGILSRALYRVYDTRFTKEQMAKIVDGIKQVLHPQGTGVLRLGPHDHDHWT
jgi:hypothetical protein